MEKENSDIIQMRNRLEERLISAEITEIEWERIICHLTVQVSYSKQFQPGLPLDFYLITPYGKANAKFQAEEKGSGTYLLSMNVSNPGYVMCLPTGVYTLYICQGNDILCEPEMSIELVPFLADKSRTFLHHSKNKGYSIDFSVTEDSDILGAVITAQEMTRAALPVLNPNPLAPKVPKLVKRGQRKVDRLKKWVLTTYYRGCHLLEHILKKCNPKRKKTILFLSEQNETIGTNLMAVADRMKARGMEKDWTILFSGRSIVEHPGYGMRSWLAVFGKMGRADVILVDDHAPMLDWLRLQKDTKLIQIWHAGAGFKSSGYSRWGHMSSPAPIGAHRQYTYGIAGSRQIAHFFSEVWGINTEQVLPTGMPRMDEYLDPVYRKKKEAELRERFPMINGKKVILFAPTYRGRNHKDASYPYELIDFDALYDFCKEDYVVLFKMHPWVAAPVPIKETQKDRFLDVGTYPNINDLFYITDLLITDYSSNIFEYSLNLKPMLFFAFDEIQYAFSRGFHRDYQASAPGKICHSFDELMEALQNRDFEEEKVAQYVKMHFDHTDSGASDRVIDWLIVGPLPEEFRKALEQKDEENKRLLQMDFSSLGGSI